uniref:Aminopeptidase n=1 Tax=Tityus serrulatus TaxID=6887 RepID=A0A1S5QN27_TITSE|nr:aminopeptidase N1 [Tityus serrulatus]
MDANNVEEQNGALNGKIKEHRSQPTSKVKEFFRKRWFLLFLLFLVLLVVVSIILILVFLIPYLKREVKNDFRLPSNLSPEHYFLEIQPYLDPKDLTFQGSVTITFVCLNATDKLILHASGINIHENSLKVVSSDGTCTMDVVQMVYDHENELVIFTLCQNFEVGRRYDIRMKFDRKFENFYGFFAVKYEDNGVEKYVAATKFERQFARRAFPCFDEPHFKSKFTVSIVRRKKYVSLSNMPLLETLKRDDEWEVDKFQTSVVMSTYLVAFSIGEFKSVENGKVAVWYLRNNSDIEFILNTAHAMLNYFERYLHSRYTLPKLDHVLLPKYSSLGMENWGLVMYNEPLFARLPTNREKAKLISHETVHQWFGNLVTPKWWDDLWLNEGFARYFGSFAVHAIHPEWRTEEQFTYLSNQIMNTDCASPERSIILSVNEQSDFSKPIYLVYSKGGLMVRMVHLLLGDEAFKKGLMSYLSENAYKNVDQDELWKRLTLAQTEKPPLNLKKMMKPWMSQAGYPIITAIRNYEKNTLKISQKSCFSYENKSSEELWNVPITLMHGSRPVINLKVTKWLTKRQDVLNDLPDNRNWTLLNVQQLGYFRVNYDENNWKSLLWQLRHNFLKIPSLNRIQILKDAMFFADTGDISHSLALDIFSYFPFEKDVLVLNVVEYSGIGEYLQNYEMAVFKTDVEEKWKKFIRYALGPIYIRYLHNWVKGKVEEELLSSKRSYINILCMYGDQNCLNNSREAMEEIFKGNNEKEM